MTLKRDNSPRTCTANWRGRYEGASPSPPLRSGGFSPSGPRSPVADRVVRSIRYVNGNVRRVEIWALRYFADVTIDKVTEAKLADYADWRLSQPKRRAVVTLKNERTAIRQLLKFAKRRGCLSDVPEFVIKSGRTNARPDIPEVEWHRLTRFLPLFVDRARDKRRQRERFYLVLYNPDPRWHRHPRWGGQEATVEGRLDHPDPDR